jgi:hypothetical protein
MADKSLDAEGFDSSRGVGKHDFVARQPAPPTGDKLRSTS